MRFKVFIFLCFLWSGTLFADNARLEQASRYANAGQYEKAIREYREILANDSKNSKAYFGAAEVRFKMKDYTGARANYQLAYRYDPKLSAAYEGAAKSYEAEGKRDLAARERAKMPQLPDFGDNTKEKKNSEPAKKQETASKNQQEQEVVFTYNGPLFTKGKNLFKEKKYGEAANIWRDVLQAQPGNPGAYYFAGIGRYEMGELDKAEINLKKGTAYPEEGYRAYYYLSLIYQNQKKVDSEKKVLNEFIRKSPASKELNQAKYRYAALTQSASVSEPPKRTVVAPTVAASKVSQEPQKKISEEKPVIPEAKPMPVQKAPLSEQEQFSIANQAFLEGDWNQALSMFRELLTLTKDEDSKVFALFQMGNIYRTRRDFRSAVVRYREIVENYPNSEWASEAERSWKEAVFQEKNLEKLPR